jgi:oligopeptide transport system ATP-binding protein
MSLLEVERLSVRFTRRGASPVIAVDEISFSLDSGRTLGIVGESGSGKTQCVLALMGLVAPNARVSGSARFDSVDLLRIDARSLNKLRGSRMAMVFQDPMTALNPFLTVEQQLVEPLIVHRKMRRREARRRAIEALERVHLPDAARRIGMYPHEFSGGMRQRVMIAMAIVTEPSLVIADEPTTALDVTVQAQIVELLRELNREHGTAMILITHDMGVAAGLCDDVMVMYAGRTVEHASARQLFAAPTHPYTIGLMNALPRLDRDDGHALGAIAGQPPAPGEVAEGCAFAQRCPHVAERCKSMRPPLEPYAADSSARRACHRPTAWVAGGAR